MFDIIDMINKKEKGYVYMITVSMINKQEEIVIDDIVPNWKITLSKQLYQCVKSEYSSEIILKFEDTKSINSLCKKISKSVLNSLYEEDILEAIANILNIKNVLESDDEIKLKTSKKLKKYFLSDELEFLRDEVCDSISRLKKEWLNI